MSQLRVAISQDFFSAFAQIPRAKQKKVNGFVSKFRANPHASGINYEKINDAASPRYRSVRIDDEYRGIILKPDEGDVYILLWVDKHDDAYDWARRHQCEVNPETGVLQLYEVVQQQAPEQPAAPPPAPERAQPLFELRDRELRRLGVPDDRLESVKALTSVEALEALGPALPVEAFEALSFLAEGLPLEEVMQGYARPDEKTVDATDYSAALDRPETRRRFHVVDDDLELQQMLEAPLEHWRVFLHPSQRRVVERNWNGPVRVLGGAGTGKTVVAMHRARWLVRNVLKPDERLLFTTFTKNLAMDIEYNLKKICSAAEMKQIEVTHIDAWIHRFLKREKHLSRIVYPGQKEFDDRWQKAMNLADGSLKLDDSFYREEWRRVILPQRVNSVQDYLKASRVGRGTPLSRKQRAKVWPVFEEIRFQLHQDGLMTVEDGAYIILDMLDEGAAVRPYRAAVVDEAQDFGPEVLRLVRAMVPEQDNDLMIVGDGHQRIYGRKAALSHCGIDIRGRGRKLRINYRTTEQIRRLATAVLEGTEVDDLDDNTDPVTGYRSLVYGDTPVLKGFDTEHDEANWVADEIQRLIAGGFQARDMCVVGRTITQTDRVKKILIERGIEVHPVSREAADDQSVPGIRLANMHRVKGLEFKIVFLVGIREGVVPLGSVISSGEDPVEQQNRELNERALLHVAGTRAAQALYIAWSGKISSFLKLQQSADTD